MNLRQLPVIPTIVVLIAAGIMVSLGVWQLGRADEKAALIAKFEAALEDKSLKPFPPEKGILDQRSLFHRTRIECTAVVAREAVAGRSAAGRNGMAQIVQCKTPHGVADVKLGWSDRPEFPEFAAGPIYGIVVPGGKHGMRVQADPPLAGLEPLAKPDPRDLPNNHLAYAGQWFFFALTALVIYWLAMKKRLSERREEN